jgi:hypothetical protein
MIDPGRFHPLLSSKCTISGRIDHDTLTVTLRAGAACLRKLGNIDQACEWEQRVSDMEAKPPGPMPAKL